MAEKEFFTGLIGNEATKLRIGKSIVDGNLPHALLIGGPSGSGKSTLALEISAAINCENKHTASTLPCRRCTNCRRICEGSFTDVKICEKPSDKATLGVDAIKELREDMFLSATESDFKVYIIDDAECMTVEAQNSLLKVLEEPPSGVIILLLAKESDKILTTIKSRTQYIAMSRFSDAELEKYLPSKSESAAKLKFDDEDKFRGIIVSADGRLGEAIRLSDPKSAEDNEAERREVNAFVSSLKKNISYTEIYSAVMALSTSKRPELIFSFERIICALRDLITVKTSDDIKLLFYTNSKQASDLAEQIGRRRLFAAYDAVNEAHSYCTRNANIGNLLHGLAARIAAYDR